MDEVQFELGAPGTHAPYQPAVTDRWQFCEIGNQLMVEKWIQYSNQMKLHALSHFPTPAQIGLFSYPMYQFDTTGSGTWYC